MMKFWFNGSKNSSNLQNFVKHLKPKISKQSNEELYALMTKNINNKKKYAKYRDQLIVNNIRLVVQKVTEYVKTTKLMIFDDLIQEGIVGLIKSIETYNPNLKYNFSTWASIHIKKYILRFMDSQYMPRPHTQITENIDRIRKISNKLYYKYDRLPTAEEVKKELDKLQKQKSKLNKKLNKERLKKSLSPFSESIGVDKDGKFIGIDIRIIKYILDIINNNYILHSLNLEQNHSNIDISPIAVENVNDDNLIGNVLYKDMYEDVISLISNLSLKHGEILDMLFGISYDRPFTFEEIRTVLYNKFDKKSRKYTIEIMSRMVKRYFTKLKQMETTDQNFQK